jgi:Transposase
MADLPGGASGMLARGYKARKPIGWWSASTPAWFRWSSELRGHERHAAYEGAMLRYLRNWLDQLRWQRLKPFEKLSQMLLDQLEGILNYCHTKVSMGVVEAVNDNITSLLRRGRGYQNLHYLLLKAQRMAVTNTEFVAFRKAA